MFIVSARLKHRVKKDCHAGSTSLSSSHFSGHSSSMTIVAIIASFIVVGIGVQAYLYQQAEQDDARTACLNANEARQANLSLWTYILDLSAANREEKPTPAEQQQIDEFKNWVGDLYAPRDCDDLSKRYKIPPPPILTGVPDEQAQ
jgi:hypothetical protein